MQAARQARRMQASPSPLPKERQTHRLAQTDSDTSAPAARSVATRPELLALLGAMRGQARDIQRRARTHARQNARTHTEQKGWYGGRVADWSEGTGSRESNKNGVHIERAVWTSHSGLARHPKHSNHFLAGFFFFDFPALSYAMAAACDGFRPLAISSPMFLWMVFLLDPLFKGILLPPR